MEEAHAHLNLLEGHLEHEALVVVRVQGAHLNRRLLLLNALPIKHQRELHVRVCAHKAVLTSAKSAAHEGSSGQEL